MNPASNKRVIYAAATDDTYYTPWHILELALAVLGKPIDLDPCTDPSNPLGARGFYAAEGLNRSWLTFARRGGSHSVASIWMNPPYGRETPAWLAKLEATITEREQRRAELGLLGVLAKPISALVLVPARPGARWYARATTSCDVVCELHGRLTFDRIERGIRQAAPAPARWGSSLLYTGPHRAHAHKLLRAVGVTRYARRRVHPRERPSEAADPRQTEIEAVIHPRPRRPPRNLC